MLSGYLVVNKETSIRDYLSRRSVMDTKVERRSLAELDIKHMEIIDVDRFLYIYYAGDDTELAFRSDLNVFRQLISSAFFHADEIIFIVVDPKQANTNDLINAAARSLNSDVNLRIITHNGTLSLNDVSQYLVGTIYGSTVTTAYQDVYIHQASHEEHERFDSRGGDIRGIIPALTDMYTAYRKKVTIEASRIITEETSRPQMLDNFTHAGKITEKRMDAYIFCGSEFSKFELSGRFLSQYFNDNGERAIIVDLRMSNSNLMLDNCKVIPVTGINKNVVVEEHNILVRTRYEQFGLIIESLNNFVGVDNMIILIDDLHKMQGIRKFMASVSNVVISSYVTHFTRESIEAFLEAGVKPTSLFLNPGMVNDGVDVTDFKSQLRGIAICQFPTDSLDPLDFYHCVIGRWE